MQCINDVRRSLNDPRRLALGGFLQPIVQVTPPPDTRAAIMNGASILSKAPLEYHTSRRITFQARLSPQTSDSGAETNHADDDSSNTTHHIGLSQALIRPTFQEDEPIEGFENPDTDEIDEIDEKIYNAIDQTLYQQPESAEQEVWEDLRVVSRKVLLYAEDILCGASETSSHGPSVGPRLQPDELPKDSEAESTGFFMKTKHGVLRMPSDMAQNVMIKTTEDGIDVIPRNDRESISVGVPVSSVSSASDLVALKDLDGRTYRVPYDSVRDWDVSSILSLLVTFAYKARMRNPFSCHCVVLQSSYLVVMMMECKLLWLKYLKRVIFC